MKLLLYILLTTLLLSCSTPDNNAPPTVSILIPMEHSAMNDIVAGFEESLRATYGAPLQFQVNNAHNNTTTERALLQNMRGTQNALIVPIGTSTTQMTLALIHQQPIISLAANFSHSERQQRNPCNLAIVHDEIPAATTFAFIHAVYPTLKNMLLIHSADDKIFPEVPIAIRAAEMQDIHLNTLLIKTTADLKRLTIPAGTEAIFILKDGPIVSNITPLVHTASQLHIPLITSDQGSVQNGAHFALGVYEKQIGEAGGKLAAAVLKGQSPCSLPIVEMSHFTVFINPHAVAKTTPSFTAITDAAANGGYHVESFGG
jgi:ABC-type uncharacterized transport system substrate-binding protein